MDQIDTLSTGQAPIRPPQPTTGLWHNRAFLLLWSGQVVSETGSQVSLFALPLLVLAFTNSPALAGFLSAIQLLPYLLFSLPAGALVDRWNRKLVMLACDTLRWLLLASVPVAFYLGHLTLPRLYAVAFLEGTANVLFGIAQLSALPRVVAPKDVPSAYMLSEITQSTAALVGPSLGGLLIQLAGATLPGTMLAYIADSFSYLVSVLSLCGIRVPFQQQRVVAQSQSLVQDVLEGLRFLWRQPLLCLVALLTTLINFMQAGITLAVILLARNTLHLDTLTLGIVISANGIGGLLGGAIAPWLHRRLGMGPIMLGSMLGWTLASALLALSSGSWMLILAMGLIGLLWPCYAVVVVSYRLSLAPDELLGRVNSSFRLLSFGIEPVGKALWGLLLLPLGARLELVWIALGLGLITLLASFTSLRRA